jgi:hypothetical protein
VIVIVAFMVMIVIVSLAAKRRSPRLTGPSRPSGLVTRPVQPVVAKLASPDPGGVVLDPDWEWEFVRRAGQPDQWVRGHCKHLKVVPVVDVDGSIPAQLCLSCDTQFNVPIPNPPDA